MMHFVPNRACKIAVAMPSLAVNRVMMQRKPWTTRCKCPNDFMTGSMSKNWGEVNHQGSVASRRYMDGSDRDDLEIQMQSIGPMRRKSSAAAGYFSYLSLAVSHLCHPTMAGPRSANPEVRGAFQSACPITAEHLPSGPEDFSPGRWVSYRKWPSACVDKGRSHWKSRCLPSSPL
jgi:hypothetical protein